MLGPGRAGDRLAQGERVDSRLGKISHFGALGSTPGDTILLALVSMIETEVRVGVIAEEGKM